MIHDEFLKLSDLTPGMFLITKEYTYFPAGWGLAVTEVMEDGFYGYDYGHNNRWFFNKKELSQCKLVDECQDLSAEERKEFGPAFTFVNWQLIKEKLT